MMTFFAAIGLASVITSALVIVWSVYASFRKNNDDLGCD